MQTNKRKTAPSIMNNYSVFDRFRLKVTLSGSNHLFFFFFKPMFLFIFVLKIIEKQFFFKIKYVLIKPPFVERSFVIQSVIVDSGIFAACPARTVRVVES